MLLDGEFYIKLRVDDLDSIEGNINKLDKKLSLLTNKEGKVNILGLIDIDIFQFMHSSKLVMCMNGSVWELYSGNAI